MQFLRCKFVKKLGILVNLYYLFSAEAGSLNSLINGAREHLKPTPPSSVKPYDMTVLLDENLEKERLCEEMKQKLFVSTSTPPGSVTEGGCYVERA